MSISTIKTVVSKVAMGSAQKMTNSVINTSKDKAVIPNVLEAFVNNCNKKGTFTEVNLSTLNEIAKKLNILG